MSLPVMAHRDIGRLSAFGKLRLWDEGHPLAKHAILLGRAKTVCRGMATSAVWKGDIAVVAQAFLTHTNLVRLVGQSDHR